MEENTEILTTTAPAGSLYYSRPDGSGGINSFALKLVAIITMTLDHASVIFLPDAYFPLRLIGRMGFPLFAFMIAEGARRTKNAPKYMLRLLVFCFISEIPFDLCLISGGSQVLEFGSQNVYFTLLLGLVAIWFIREFSGKTAFLRVIGPVLCLCAAWVINTDYCVQGVLTIILFYVFADKKKGVKIAGYFLTFFVLCLGIYSLPDLYEAQGSIGAALSFFVHNPVSCIYFNPLEVPAFLSLPLVYFYNGRKGRNVNKYVFYGFYPAHILILYAVFLIARSL